MPACRCALGRRRDNRSAESESFVYFDLRAQRQNDLREIVHLDSSSGEYSKYIAPK